MPVAGVRINNELLSSKKNTLRGAGRYAVFTGSTSRCDFISRLQAETSFFFLESRHAFSIFDEVNLRIEAQWDW